MATLLTMSTPELDRCTLMRRIQERRLTQRKAADLLGLSVRQVERLYHAYKSDGPQGLISKKRGQPGNRRLPAALKQRTLALIRDQYPDFGPTLAAEKLLESHGIAIGVETLRRWMIEAGLWTTRTQRLPRAFQPRHRRACFGELIQIDGSEHAWFEARGPKCTLLVYVDDATSQLGELRFVHSESTFSYFAATSRYLKRHGKPIAFYSDKASVFRTNKKGAMNGDGVTQFGRALHDLNIEIICANTCQAKGRVERAHLTLQDRLVKELRLKAISTIEAANRFLPTFMKQYNAKFGKPPKSDYNAHRPLQTNDNLKEIFCWQEVRTLTKALTVQYDKIVYCIKDSVPTRKLANKQVLVHDYPDGSIKITHDGHTLPYTLFDKLQRVDQGAIVDNKRLGAVLAFVRQKQNERNEQRSQSCPSRKDRYTISP